MVQRPGHCDGMSKNNLEAFEMWVGRRMKGKINWLGHWLRRKCLLNEALEGMVNGKEVRGRRRYQMIDSIMINGLYEDTKRKAEKRVEWRMLTLQ